jgi:hypothetical protein
VSSTLRVRPYCSDASRVRGDDNTATAARIDVWILVEFPGVWGRDALTDSLLPAAVREALEHAQQTIARSRVILIRRRTTTRDVFRVYVARSAPRAGLTALEVASLDDVAALPFAELAQSATGAPSLPLVLVCTHGQHDSCCGRRGFPLYDALKDREELDVWQCSHIGGDRFAANALVLPWGLFYGPVEPGEAEPFATSILRDEIYLPGYRGRCSLSRVGQAAETFIRRSTGILARDAFRLAAREHLPNGVTKVRLVETNGTAHEVVLEQFTAAEEVFATCRSSAAGPVRQFRVVT